ncbi:MAG: biosynthetic-type acetolactate synthase large subunit [Bacteroidota bacterium]
MVQCLLEEGVDLIFGYPGGAIMPVYDAFYDVQDQLKHVLTRHEQGATHAAQGYARATGKVGVAIATSGPGATNLITGLADAMIDSTPMVCITGQVPRHLLGTDAFQETDIISISIPVTKWNYQITHAEEIPHVLAKAFYLARSGRPGPVLIDITKNAQLETLEFDYKPCTRIRSYVPKPKLNIESIQEAAQLINAAKKPMIVFGQGVILSEAEKALQAFVEKTGIPSAWTIMGLSAMDTDHPLNVGMVGMHGNYGPNMLTNQCDVLIAVGMRFDDRVTGDVNRYAKQAKVIHIEIDPAEIDKNVKTNVAVLADAREALEALTAFVDQREHTDWLAEFHRHDKIEHEQVISKEWFPESGPINMGEVIHQLNAYTKGEAILVTDVGQHQMFGCRYKHFKRSKSNLTSGGLGTMGFALPAALGAQLGCPDRPVVAVIGDGGFQMTIQELGAIAQTGAPVKILILNNNFLGMVRQWQQLFFDKRYSATEMVNPNFTMITQGYGIPAKKVEERANLAEALQEMMESDGPFLLEVMVGQEDNVFPMIPSGAAVDEIRLA